LASLQGLGCLLDVILGRHDAFGHDELRDIEHTLADVRDDARGLGERTAPSRECIPYLKEENRVLRELHGRKRLRFSDDQRRSDLTP